MSRYVTFHPWGHEPADSLVLAGVLRAVWAVHEVPLLLDRQADGSIVIGEGQPVPAVEPEVDGAGCDIAAKPIPADVTPAEKPAAPKPAQHAAKAPAATSAPRRGGRPPAISDEDLDAAVRQHGPIGATALADILEVRSAASLGKRLHRLAEQGTIEKAGTTFRAPTAPTAPAQATAPTTNGTSPARTPAKPGVGPLGPIERRPVDHHAARLRAAGEV